MAGHGRVTIPTQVGLEAETVQAARALGADAVRNSDGTALPPEVAREFDKAVATYFVARGDNAWAEAHPRETQQFYLLSKRVTALGGSVEIDPLAGYFTEQVRPNLDDDPARWWEVMDRTTGEVVTDWRLTEEGRVIVSDAVPWHEYTVAFLAYDIWDPTQMYNHLTNDWGDTPHDIPFDARHPDTWAHMLRALRTWLTDHPEADVVRFTTFFYHFTLVYDDAARDKFVDWFGYSASVSPQAIDAFEAEHGYRLRPEHFVDEGYYNSPFRLPSREFRDWLDFQQRFVSDRARQLVELAHSAGREAMMFLGDNWIGTEPYGEHFGDIGLDAVVGSVGSGATLRMIADIPHVRYTEGRFLPYFFPDVFNPQGDPIGEANENWMAARRAQVRGPLDRIGYGGYLSLALEHPGFLDRIAEICEEFRGLHDGAAGTCAYVAPLEVGVLNAWGRLRSWQTHMVAHALWYKQTYSYLGVLEALAGLPVRVRFVDFDEAMADGGLAGLDVLVNAGAAGTAFSGGSRWAEPRLQETVRRFVADGGGLIGVGEPTACQRQGAFFQLSDVLGVDRETGLSLSTKRYPRPVTEHFVTAQLSGSLDVGEGAGDIFAIDDATELLACDGEWVRAAARSFGDGRAVYVAGLPYSADNARLLMRALAWSAHREEVMTRWQALDPRVDVAAYPEVGRFVTLNSSSQELTTTIWDGTGEPRTVTLPAMAATWHTI